MVNKLHLDPEQRDQIAQIIKDSQERNKELWQEIAPQMREELKRVQDEIRLALRPGQVRRFNELMRENRRDKNTAPFAGSDKFWSLSRPFLRRTALQPPIDRYFKANMDVFPLSWRGEK